jgi:hypothetical protein
MVRTPTGAVAPAGFAHSTTLQARPMTADDFREIALRNPANDALLDELLRLGLGDAWVVAGALAQTVWNVKSGCAVGHGIDDYDVFYFDSDLSWEAEDRVIARFSEASARLGIRIEARNQARVHLWYGQKYGVPYPALQCSTDGIDRFLTRCTQVGLQRVRDGDRVYAPAGFDELDAMIVRPNLTPNFSVAAYRKKTARWLSLWPELTIEAPPETEAP